MIDPERRTISAANERSVHAMYDAERRRDIEAWAALWHAEGRQTLRTDNIRRGIRHPCSEQGVR